MISYHSGDLFRDEAEVLVNPVNTVGVMGKGLAAGFKTRYPGMFRAYREACKAGSFHVGQVLVVSDNDRRIACLPTKRHWRSPSRLEDVEAGLAALARHLTAEPAESVVVPALGCGLGGLAWRPVETAICTALGNLATDVRIYPPH
ncbi:macro domain-containing protein [Salininema proteolyticum]|uniref:Macro domain-containing protein n=1 Tax=Salininema proteolyticum TaxID=1607685 RepID=A0ABV8U2Q9_9ACTN